MNIRILGAGWYGLHLAKSLLREGCKVVVHEIKDHIFAGASGANPARLHLGFHYPRSKVTRAFCQEHQANFLHEYGQFTRAIRTNIYAIADRDSYLDFGTYCQILQGELEFIKIFDTDEYGLNLIEGALLTGERHIQVDKVVQHFNKVLRGAIEFNIAPDQYKESDFDLTIDCTFCSQSSANVERYEPCITALLEGPTDRAVTIMDGPFPSLYPWSADDDLCSLTSALYTPLSKTCRTWEAAQAELASLSHQDALNRIVLMINQMAAYWPEVRDVYRVADYKLAVRAQPRSGSDARFVDIIKVGDRTIRVRAGKIDAVVYAEELIQEFL